MAEEGVGWLCEPVDAPSESWMSDAYWVRANERHGHRSTVRSPHGVHHIFDTMELVPRTDFVRQLFYGDSFLDRQFTGFARRYSTLNPLDAQNAANVIDGRGDREGPLTSAWLIGWGRRTMFMFTPDGGPHSGPGEIGLAVVDWRYAVRVANVSPQLDADHFAALLSTALLKLPSLGKPETMRPVYYVTPGMLGTLGNDRFRGLFVRALDLHTDEAAVSADKVQVN